MKWLALFLIINACVWVTVFGGKPVIEIDYVKILLFTSGGIIAGYIIKGIESKEE